MHFFTKHQHKIVFVLVAALSTVAWWFSYQANLILTYNDAASHLNIARRVVDSITPGFAQIGTVWLPLPHFLMIPFAANDFLWHTGLGGSIVSMLAYIVGALFFYKLLHLITKNIPASGIGTLILVLNPNLLYMQTTPMTETLLITSIIMSVYFIAKYMKTDAINDLIMGSALVAASTLIRYDGWFLFASLAVLVPIWVFALHGRKRAESSLILFLSAGGFGIFLWVIWNLAIFGDALYFIYGPYSAAAQQKVLKSVGQLPTEGNIYNAVTYYLWAVISNNGLMLTLAAAVSAFILPFVLKIRRQWIAVIAILTPIVFNIVALYLGQSALNVPQAPTNPGMFNTRYGLMALPAIALLLGVVSANKILRYAVLVILIVQSYFFVIAGVPITLADGAAGLKNTYYTVEASKWLREHYEGGLILTSLASHDAFVARAQLPMKYYIHEGTRDHWDNALKYPSGSATYIAVLSFPPDSVYRAIYQNPDFQNNYKLVHKYEKFEIYKKK